MREKLFMAAAISAALCLPVPALAMGSDAPPADTKATPAPGSQPKADAKPAAPPAAKAEDKKPEAPKTEEKKSFLPSPAWIARYREAAALIKAERFDDAIAALQAMPNADLSADVQNYLGFAHRKLKLMEASRGYYERALALDPQHKGALEYYGEWHAEAGDLVGAQKLLARLKDVCGGTNCEEYAELAKAIKTREAAAARPRG
jgi:tetratricopeptide (TPR) repeat protein